ncbi:MAG: septal ring lytic transglycosylase RlpA family protein [Alphaproteobacteria bacterium]
MLMLLTACGSRVAGSILKSPSISGMGKTKFQIENGTHYKIGNPYVIEGRTYYPKENYNYKEEGVASWYGPNFHAKPTANGGVFDMNKYTAAHRTLPIPSVVRVTNLQNGLSMIVKVNDRGPYAKDRIIDLSRATAQKLGVIKKGTAFVRVEILPKESKKYKQAMARGHSAPRLNHMVSKVDLNKLRNKNKNIASGIYIQAGVFGDYNNAIKLANNIKKYGKTKLHKMEKDGNTLYAVRIGPVEDSNIAKNTINKLMENGYEAIIKLL